MHNYVACSKDNMAKYYTHATNSTRQLTVLKIICVLLALLSVALIMTLIVILTRNQTEPASKDQSSSRELDFCPENTKLTSSSPARSSGLYDDLSEEEIVAVRDYILSQSSLNITAFKDAEINDNYIYLIELQQPIKDIAIQFLDNNGPKPERVARVVIYFGGKVSSEVREYLVSPAAKPIRYEETTGPGQKYPIPYDARPEDSKDVDAMELVIEKVSEQVRDLFYESYDGYTYHDCTDRCLYWDYSSPGEFGLRKKWVRFTRDLPGKFLHPVGFEIYVNTQGSDVSLWKIEKVLYHNTSFDSVEDLMAAYKNGSVYKVFLPAPSFSSETPLFSSYLRRGKPQLPKPLRPPQLVEPDGKRYTVSGRHVAYMKWSFDFRFRSSTSLQLFDVSFDGQRIVYELSLQEAAAFYSGWSPMQMFSNYLDTAWGMGSSKFGLVPGVDCPSTATFIDAVHLVNSNDPVRFKGALCLFELNLGIPLHRHFDYEDGFKFYGGMPGSALVLRTISTAFNYDYIYDYLFYPNGVVEVRVSTSGYVQSTYWTSQENPYGTEVHKGMVGTVHDHIFNYKVDLDIGGRKNYFENVDIKIENITSPWIPGARRVQKVLSRTLKKTEQEAIYRFNFDHPKYLNFFSEGNVNKMCVKRGYRIDIRDMMKQLYPKDWGLVKGAAWGLNQMTVTKRKETEETSSSFYNQYSMYDPVVDFEHFVADNETIVNEDLVAWVTTGLMHVPHSEDIPNTATAANSASFFLRPYNYFDEDPSIASHDAVLISPAEKGFNINRFGTPEGRACAMKNKPLDFKGAFGE